MRSPLGFLTLVLLSVSLIGCGSGSTSESTIETDELSQFMAEHPELDREPLEYEYE